MNSKRSVKQAKKEVMRDEKFGWFLIGISQVFSLSFWNIYEENELQLGIDTLQLFAINSYVFQRIPFLA